MTEVVWLGFDGASPRGRWDQTWLSDLLPDGRVEADGWEPDGGTAVVVVAGEVDSDRLEPVLERLDRVLVIAASNEERLFSWGRHAGPGRVLWLHTPDPYNLPQGYDHWRPLPTGWSPGVVDRFAASCPAKDIPVSFVGQVTHARREALAAKLATIDGALLAGSDHFTGDLAPSDYADVMRRTIVAPCPAGNVSLDTFRLYEALQAGAVPLVDFRTSQGDVDHRFWTVLLGSDHPLWYANERWDDLTDPALRSIDTRLAVGAWWTRFKGGWHRALADDLRLLGAGPDPEPVTVLVTASPIPSHPDTGILDTTIESIRLSLPGARIIVGFDGIRDEQQHRAADYHEHIRRVLWAAANRWSNVEVVVEPTWVHQANLTHRLLAEVDTDLILFVEHDTPVVGEIDWPAAIAAVSGDVIDSLRFHYSASIHPDHEYLMLDQAPIDVAGCPLIRTTQWSQRPHLAKAEWYRDLLDEHFPAESRTMIEDRMHSVAQQHPGRYRLAVYAPPGPAGFLRSGHTDGRDGDVKYEMRYR